VNSEASPPNETVREQLERNMRIAAMMSVRSRNLALNSLFWSLAMLSTAATLYLVCEIIGDFP
jgi:hypothetical protein